MTVPAGHANRVFEKSTTTGTGNLLLSGAETGFYSFFSSFGVGVTLGYVAENPITGENEVGIGEVIDNGGGSYSLKRNSVETSSNGNALVNFAAGFKYCRATFLASEGAIVGAGFTGTGPLVRQTSPTIITPTLTTPTMTTPILGAATATSINKVTITAPATGSTITLADGSTLATSGANAITLTSSGATNVTLPTAGTLATLAGAETLTNKTLTSPIIGTISNTGTLTLPTTTDTLVGRATVDTLTNKTLTSPTLTTPILGAATATSINKVTITAPATGSTITLADGKTLTASNTLTLTATDGSTLAIGTGGTLAALAYLASVDCSGAQVTGTLAAARMPALTGDVTTSAGAVATTIGTNAVTFAKIQQLTTQTLVGNATGGTANATAITLGASLTFSGSTLNTVQNIGTTSSPTFNQLTITTVINGLAITPPGTSATLTLASGSTLATAGANSITLTSSGATNVTLPTAGTLATLAGVETFTNKSIVATQLTGTIAAARMPALTGDVTTSAGAVATTLTANAVTFAKFQQMSTVTLLGNATGGTANAAEITLGTSLTFSGSTLNTIQGLRFVDSPTFAGASFVSTTIAGPTITGGSSSGQGGYFLWQRTGATNPFYLGHRAAILGGTSGNAILYSSADNIEFAPAATATVTLTSTTSTFTTSILSTSATAASGFATGAGGSVTQATSRTTGVTLSKPCGTITTNSTSLAAGATAKFTVTNTLVAAADNIILTIQSGTTTDATRARVQSTAAGSFTIVIENGHASTAETGAILLNFEIRKSVTA